MACIINGESIEWDNNTYNLYDYYKNITLNENSEKDVAVIFDEKRLNFKEVHETIIKISNYIYKTIDGLDDENRVKIIGIHLSPDLHLVPILLSIHRLGCSYVPIDHNLPIERIKYVLNNAKFDCIISNANDCDYLTQIKPEVRLIHIKDALKTDIDEVVESKVEKLKRKIDDIACILFTSGSTGSPKGVCLNHRSIMNRIKWQWKEFPLEKNYDFGIQKTSLNFVDHICEIFAFILKGLPLLIIHPTLVSNMQILVDTIFQHKITYIILVPSLLNNIISYVNYKSEFFKLESVKRWVCSGEALNYKTLESFFNMNLKNSIISNFYGSTEVTGDISFIVFKSKNDLIQFKNSSIPIGVPVSNSGMEILDENMNCVSLNNIGEIYASGACLAEGYLNKSENSSEFINHNSKLLFKTGDYGYIGNDKLVYYSGRKDTQIKIRGNRVDLNEIEFNALKINEIEQFIPLVYENESNKTIIGFYKTKSDVSIFEIEKVIINSLKTTLLDYMLPNKLIRLDSIPYLFNGKIDKISLLKLYEKDFYKIHDKSICENQIANLIESVTKVKIELEDFHLSLNHIGIDSLNILNIYLLLQEKEGINFSFNEFLSLPTLNELIDFCENLKRKDKFKEKPQNMDQSIYQDTNYGKRLKIVMLSENPELADNLLRMCGQTFTQKSSLEKALNITENIFYDELKPMVDILKNSSESFGVIDTKTEKLVGCAFICDVTLPITFNGKNMKPIFCFLDEIKQDIVDKMMSENKKVLQSILITTTMESETNENVILIDYIESQIILIAKKLNYDAIVTVNTIKTTEDICKELKGYVEERKVITRDFVYESEKIFLNLPESEVSVVCVKYL